MRYIAIFTMFAAGLTAADYAAPDGSFRMPVPDGWRVRTAPVAGQTMTIVEPANGGEERFMVGSGIAQATNIQELTQQAFSLAAQFLPGAMLSAAPKFSTIAGVPAAEQEYRNMQLEAWNGMLLRDGVYFAVMGVATPGKLETLRARGRQLLGSGQFQGPPPNPRAEAALQGQWVLSDNRTHNSGVRDKLMYMSNWTLTFLPGNRFQSFKESFVDTSTATYGGGSTDAAARHTGRYRVFGQTLVADVDGVGRQIYALEFYPNGAGVKVNGQLFLRQ